MNMKKTTDWREDVGIGPFDWIGGKSGNGGSGINKPGGSISGDPDNPAPIGYTQI